ncbi:hypothetical protein N7497_010301 [Penicillium chrysogenum]|nr:hypothetical protein N7497_010301 [Penicillium chrysogenum]
MAENQAAGAGGDRPLLGPGEIGPNNARNRALKKRRREAQAAPGGSPPIGTWRNRAMKKRRREAQAAQAAPGGSPPPLGPGEIGPNNPRPINESFLLFQWQKAKLPVPGGDRPPLGPGEIGPNNARNRALKKRRRQAQAAREQAAVVEARRRELENEFAHDMVRARANARLAVRYYPLLYLDGTLG